jgi:hypothetical protein
MIYDLPDFQGVVRTVEVYFDGVDNEFVAKAYKDGDNALTSLALGEGRSQESPLDAAECAIENWRCREKDRINIALDRQERA